MPSESPSSRAIKLSTGCVTINSLVESTGAWYIDSERPTIQVDPPAPGLPGRKSSTVSLSCAFQAIVLPASPQYPRKSDRQL